MKEATIIELLIHTLFVIAIWEVLGQIVGINKIRLKIARLKEEKEKEKNDYRDI